MWSSITILGLVITLFMFGYWFISLIPKPDPENAISKVTVEELPYLSKDIIEKRGKVLAVVTSTEIMGTSGKATGFELTELSRAYYVFLANGFEVDIASPKGGKAPVIIDDEDMGAYDFAFLNDSIAQEKIENTLTLKEIVASDYAAIYFVGGKGAMYDFPDNTFIQDIVKSYYQKGKVVGAVCHGPAALVNVTLDGDEPLLAGKSVCSFTNSEELLLIPEAKSIFPFLLEDKLVQSGANFNEGTMYLENVVHDENLITGQNPWSTWKVAETMVSQMGYLPKTRIITAEENAIQILGLFHKQGYQSAKTRISELTESQLEIDRTLIAMHSIVAAMQWDLVNSIKLIGLLKFAKEELEAKYSLQNG